VPLAKQSSAFEQHPTTVVCDDADEYDGVHELAHAYVFVTEPVAVAAV
jgi:hypothetical protein